MLYHLLFADTYAVLSNMGVEVPIEHLEKTFKINGLKYKENYGFGFGSNAGGLNFQSNNQREVFSSNFCGCDDKSEAKHTQSYVSELLANSAKSAEKTNASNPAKRLLNKANTLYADEFERFFAEFKEQNADFDFEKFESIFENSSSFENAEKALLKAYKGEEFAKAEKVLASLVANGAILGDFLGGENDGEI